MCCFLQELYKMYFYAEALVIAQRFLKRKLFRKSAHLCRYTSQDQAVRSTEHLANMLFLQAYLLLV